MSLPNGKNFKNWIIRRRFLRPLCKATETVSTTTRKVRDEISNLR